MSSLFAWQHRLSLRTARDRAADNSALFEALTPYIDDHFIRSELKRHLADIAVRAHSLKSALDQIGGPADEKQLAPTLAEVARVLFVRLHEEQAEWILLERLSEYRNESALVSLARDAREQIEGELQWVFNQWSRFHDMSAMHSTTDKTSFLASPDPRDLRSAQDG